MLHRRMLLLLAALTLCALPAWSITFTGDVDADFTGPGIQDFPDVVPDAGTGLAGCDDVPLGANAYQAPQPPENLIPASGFNIARVAAMFDCANDALYVGLDTCDPRIIFDADVNNNVTTLDPTGGVPGALLRGEFTDTALEDYQLEFDINNDGSVDLTVLVLSLDGGLTTEPPTIVPNIPGVSVVLGPTAPGTPDLEVKVTGLLAAFPGAQVAKLVTRSGSTGDLVNEDITEQVISMPCPCIDIEKYVSCYADGPWAASADVLRGADVYFKIVVTNCGNEDLTGVQVTDMLSGSGYVGSIPSPIDIGDLAVSASWEQVYMVGTDPAYSDTTKDPDFTNSASVTGTGASSGTGVNAGPAEAEVNILVPKIVCDKWADADGDFTSGATKDLRLDGDGVNDIEEVWFKLCVNNEGEVDVDFAPGDLDCPDFWDPFLEIEDPTIPGTGVDIDAEFLAAIQSEFGGTKLPAGESVCIVVGPVIFDEAELCPERRVFLNRFQACGIAWEEDICLPGGAGEVVSTSICEAAVTICNIPGATRTPGYWMTHARALQYAINAMYEETGGMGYKLVDLFGTYTFACPDHCAIIGNTAIPNIAVATCEGKLAWELLKATPGSQPSPNLHVAAILEFQLIAGIANVLTLDAGGVVVDGTTLGQLVTDALALTEDCMISDDEIDEALMLAEKIDWANNDPVAHDQPLPDGFPKFRAEPKFFKNLNCTGCPDNPPMP